MRKYESIFVVSGDAPESKYLEIVKKLSEAIEKNDGKILKIDDWGKKTLAFEVKKQNRGYYTLFELAGEGNLIHGFERQCQLLEDVLLVQTVKLADKIPEEELAEVDDCVKTFIDARETARAEKKEAAAATTAKANEDVPLRPDAGEEKAADAEVKTEEKAETTEEVKAEDAAVTEESEEKAETTEEVKAEDAAVTEESEEKAETTEEVKAEDTAVTEEPKEEAVTEESPEDAPAADADTEEKSADDSEEEKSE
jgi:small subunit ribosomal protein S6